MGDTHVPMDIFVHTDVYTHTYIHRTNTSPPLAESEQKQSTQAQLQALDLFSIPSPSTAHTHTHAEARTLKGSTSLPSHLPMWAIFPPAASPPHLLALTPRLHPRVGGVHPTVGLGQGGESRPPPFSLLPLRALGEGENRGHASQPHAPDVAHAHAHAPTCSRRGERSRLPRVPCPTRRQEPQSPASKPPAAPRRWPPQARAPPFKPCFPLPRRP